MSEDAVREIALLSLGALNAFEKLGRRKYHAFCWNPGSSAQEEIGGWL